MPQWTVAEIRNIAVLGAGLMGHGIAQVFAQKGYPVKLYDVDPAMLQKALIQIRGNLETFVEVGLEREEKVETILSSLRTTVDLREAVKEADFVVEAVPEDLMLKMDLFREVDRLASDTSILASNTSTIPLVEIGRKVEKKERLVITHWFNPPHIIPTVEIVRGEMTSPTVFDVVFELMERIGKRPVKVLKDIPGFLINRIQTAMYREILSLVENGVAEPADIDAAVQGSFGLRLAVLGPLSTMDMGGLEVLHKGMKFLYPFLDRSTEIQKTLREKVERGEFGLKTGKGFFEYRNGSMPGPAAYSKKRDKKLLSLLKTLSEE
jgi:3-hydroxybutyryl-CoA dehydrogenase